MLDSLRDPVWQFVGVILTLFSLAAAFWIYWLQRQTKELAFGLVSSRRLLSIADELSSRVTVQLDGKPVGNLHLIVYGLKNSGHCAIAPNDWERKLSLSFIAGQVLSAEVSAQMPSNIGAELMVLDSRIELAPLLLNPGDQLLIQVLLSSAEPKSLLDARVVDVHSFVGINTTPRLPRFIDSALPIMIAMFLVGGLVTYIWSDDKSLIYSYGAVAIFIALFGWVSRLRQDRGQSARRRIDEA